MRLLKQKLRGFGPYKRAIEINYDSFGPGIIALVGRKGTGKSILLEGILVSLYLQGAQRAGSLYEYTSGTDAYAETEFLDDSGAIIRNLVNVDPDRSKTEAYIFKDDVALTTGRQSEFNAEVEKRFGSLRLVLSSIFAAQDKTGNFISMKKGERKQLFGELLDLSGIGLMHASAKAMREESEQQLSNVRRKISDLETELANRDQITQDLEAITLQVNGHRASIIKERARFEELQEQQRQSERLSSERDAASLRLDELTQQASAANASVKTIEAHLEEMARLFERQVAELEASASEEIIQSLISTHSQKRTDLNTRLAQARATIEERSVVEAAELDVKRLRDLIKTYADARANSVTISRSLDTATAKRSHSMEMTELRTADLKSVLADDREGTIRTEAITARRILEQKSEKALASLDDRRQATNAAKASASTLQADRDELRQQLQVLTQLLESQRDTRSSIDLARAALSHAQATENASREALLSQASRLAEAPCTAADKWAKVIHPAGEPKEHSSLDVALSALCPMISNAQDANQQLAIWVTPDAVIEAERNLQSANDEYNQCQIEIEGLGCTEQSIGARLDQIDARLRELSIDLNCDIVSYETHVNDREADLEAHDRETLARIQAEGERQELAARQLSQIESESAEDLGRIDLEIKELEGALLRQQEQSSLIEKVADVDTLDIDLERAQTAASRRAIVDEAINIARRIEQELAAFVISAREQQRAVERKIEQATSDLIRVRSEYEASVIETSIRLNRAQTDYKKAVETRGQVIATRDALNASLAELASSEDILSKLSDLRTSLSEFETQLDKYARRQGQLEAFAEAMDRTAASLDAEQATLREIETNLGDWRLIEAGYGPNGIQALEIDAAAPALSDLANTLLELCEFEEGRATISLETLREKKTAPGEYTEVFEIQVYINGQKRRADLFSVGEQALLNASISLALSAFNALRAGLQWRTLFLDETVSNLDPESALDYVSMVRKAMEMGGFYQAILVSHVTQVQEAADVQIHVGNGEVKIG